MSCNPCPRDAQKDGDNWGGTSRSRAFQMHVMKLDLLPTAFLSFGCACSAASSGRTCTPAKNPTGADLPVLHGAVVHGPFPDEAALCQSVYEGQLACSKRSSQRVAGPTSATAGGFGRVEIVDAGGYDDRCAIAFQVADRLYVHDSPGLCLSTGHSHYMPTVREIAFRDLDGISPGELVIIADVEIAYDEVEDAPPRTTPPIPALTMAIICGQRGGGTPSCVSVTTKAPEEFLATHRFRF
jgi:hypothetical protein